jgi:hypothetical protein
MAGRKPPNYLANKTEILAHFQDIVAAASEEAQVEVVTLFGYEFGWDHKIVEGAVECVVKWAGDKWNSNQKLTPPELVHIRADKMIKAMGFQIQIKEPLVLPTQRVVSLCPADILRPAWNAYMRAEGRDKPIYFVGSGKVLHHCELSISYSHCLNPRPPQSHHLSCASPQTAMDCIYHLCKNDVNSVFANRLHMIAGRGMQFINRDALFPTDWWSKNMYGTMVTTGNNVGSCTIECWS